MSSILRAVQTFNRDADRKLSLGDWAAEYNTTPGELIMAISRHVKISPSMACAAVPYLPTALQFNFCKEHSRVDLWWEHCGGSASLDDIKVMLEITPPNTGIWWEMILRLSPGDRREYLARSHLIDDIFAEAQPSDELISARKKIRMLEQINNEQHATIISLSSEIDELDMKCAKLAQYE